MHSERQRKPGGQRNRLDLELLERLLSDPSLTIAQAAQRVGIHRNTVYRNKDGEWHDLWRRAMRRRDLSKPVTVKVREAIEQGHDTKSKINRATGLWYDQIERGLVDLGNIVASEEVGGVEHYTLVDDAG